MKLGYQAIAWAGLGLLAPAAHAQSSLSFAGVVDLSVRHANSGASSATTLASGGNSTSRLIISGTEDLGAGWRAGFWLEGTMFADTGGGGLQFDRRSTVSLYSRFGELRLGRDWTPVFWGSVMGDPFVATGVGSISNFLNPGVNTVFQRAFGAKPSTLSRASNAVEYWLPPDLGGVYGQVMQAFGEQVVGQSQNAQGNYKYQAYRLGYRTKQVDVAIYGGRTRIDAAQRHLTQQGVYGAYTFDGGTRLSAAVTQSSYLDARQRHLLVGLSVPIQQWVIKAAYNHLDQKGGDGAGRRIDANDAASLTLGVEYHLSKRTLVYGTAAHLRNKGAAKFTVAGAPITSVTPGARSRGYEIGVRTSF